MINVNKILLLFVVFLSFYITPLRAEDKLKVEVLIAGDWGTQGGQFGIEKTGKTELGYALDFFVTADNIYILDSINNRIQVFDVQGKLKEIIKLNIKWQEFGLPWNFTMFQNYFYMLIGKPPYYSPVGLREVFIFSKDGQLIRTFGKEQLARDKEEYYYRVLQDGNSGDIVCGINGNKIIAFDSDGTYRDKLMITKGYPIETIKLQSITPMGYLLVNRNKPKKKEKRTVIFDTRKKMVKNEIDGNYFACDKDDNYYRIKSHKDRRGAALLTKIDIYNAKGNQLKTFSLAGDIKVSKNNNEKVFHTVGIFYELSQVGPEGNIYYLMALKDGVILRKIVWKDGK
ncbi:MAG: hypothetical protein A2Y97_03700 [Nitrospirae bacterium RBG_13_39_12]|nr:MAG: hypothetical protein A2Y97_03700 [Nitrospirae bacterium RBG_13_39_12]